MTQETARLLNLIACSLTGLTTVILLFRLWIDLPPAYRFVFRAFCSWSLSWAVWCLLWGILFFNPQPSAGSKVLLLCLSDANTIFVILFYLGLTRGKKYGLGQYGADGFLFALVVALGIVAFYLLGQNATTGAALHEKWSLALGMCSPVFVGWAIRLRYDTTIPLVIGFTYALTQPAAYEAIFGTGLSPEVALGLLASLSFLKILWACSVAAYLGVRPLSAENLVRRPKGHLNPLNSSQWWKTVVAAQLIIGVLAVVLVLWLKSGQQWPAGVVRQLLTSLAVVVLLKGLTWVFSRFRRALGLEDPDTAH